MDWLIAVLRYGHGGLYCGPVRSEKLGPHLDFLWWIDWLLFLDRDTECCIAALLDTSVKHGHHFDFYGWIDWLRFLDTEKESSIAALLDTSGKHVPHLTFTDGLIGWLIAAFLRYGHGELYCSLVGHECETRAPLWLGGGAYRLLLPQHGHQPGPLRRSQGQPWVPVPVLQAGLLEPLLFDSGQIPAPVPTPTPTSTLKHVIFI